MFWILATAAHGACAEDALDNAAFRERLTSGWTRLQQGEPDAFRSALLEAERAIGCLSEPVGPATAARFHRNRALASALTGDSKGAVAAAAAARRLDPDSTATWVEEVPELAGLLEQAPTAGPTTEFATSLAARVYSDGEPVAARVSGQPVLIQVFSPEGPPVGGAFIDARKPLPDWVAYPPVVCDGAVPVGSLVADVGRAEIAFTELDVEGFEAALQRIAIGLPCVDQALTPVQAAAIHRLEGLRLYTHGARLGAVRSFQEARLLDAAYAPPPELIREGSSLGALWDRAGSAGSPPWLASDVPEAIDMRVDGIATRQRPATLPSIVQVFGTGGEVWTRYVPAAAPLPDLSRYAPQDEEAQIAQLPPALQLYRQDRRDRRRSNLNRGLQLGGAVLLASAGWMYGVNANHVAEFRDPYTDPERLPKLRSAANRAAGACTLLLTAGAVGIGASFVIR